MKPDQSFYLWLNDQQAGPFTMLQLRGMWTSGSITGLTMYWQEHMPDWLPLSLVAEQIEQTAAPLPVKVASTDPFAAYHGEIQGKKDGMVTPVGVLGILLGVGMIIGGAVMLHDARSQADQQTGLSILSVGVFFAVGCFFWARAPKA